MGVEFEMPAQSQRGISACPQQVCVCLKPHLPDLFTRPWIGERHCLNQVPQVEIGGDADRVGAGEQFLTVAELDDHG